MTLADYLQRLRARASQLRIDAAEDQDAGAPIQWAMTKRARAAALEEVVRELTEEVLIEQTAA